MFQFVELWTFWLFFFFIFKKIKISKIYVHFEIFQKYTPVALWGRQALNVIFLFKFATRSLAGKKMKGGKGGLSSPPNGRQGGPVAPPRATGGPRPQARQGGLSPPPGDRVTLPYIRPPPSFPLHLSSKNPPKFQKKREAWGEGKRRSPAGFLTCDLLVSIFSLCIFLLVL